MSHSLAAGLRKVFAVSDETIDCYDLIIRFHSAEVSTQNNILSSLECIVLG